MKKNPKNDTWKTRSWKSSLVQNNLHNMEFILYEWRLPIPSMFRDIDLYFSIFFFIFGYFSFAGQFFLLPDI